MKEIITHDDLKHSLQSPGTESPITSDTLSFVNRSGKRIVGYCDHVNGSLCEKGVVILVPAYGRSKSSGLPLAYYLALNGFKVLRYDNTNHVGESEGPMLFTSLSQMREDLRSAIDFAEKEFGTSRFALVSSSLGVRVALKEAAKDHRVQLLISLIGVLNLQGTLYAIYCEDGVQKALNGTPLGLRDILGFQVDADYFLKDAIRGNFHTLETSIQDAAELRIPAVFFVADKDPWVSSDEVQKVVEHIPTGPKELHVLPNTMHELLENPKSADYACRKVVASVQRYLVGMAPQEQFIQSPESTYLLRRSREEKKKLRSAKGLNTEEEKQFWKRYLEKYAYIVNLQDYWNLLDFLYRLLGESTKEEKILDAGCGIGTFGSFVLVHHLYRVMQGKAVSPRASQAQWIGVDFIDEAIQQAVATHTGIQMEFKRKMGLLANGPDVVSHFYSVLDLNHSLPFQNHSFDKVFCNFVLSYLSDPLCTLKELSRTLKVGGKIVVTSLKPYADLSRIYQNFIQVSRTQEELELARLVLNNAGLIKHKEAEGYYQFLSQEDLHNLLLEAKLKNIQTFRSFGDQANIAIADKLGPT